MVSFKETVLPVCAYSFLQVVSRTFIRKSPVDRKEYFPKVIELKRVIEK